MSEIKSGDWSYCPACGGPIDTGWECNKCGRDWLEYAESRDDLIRQLKAAQARVRELDGALPGKLAGERALNDEKCKWFYERATKAEATVTALRTALAWVLAYTQKPDYFPNEGDAQWWTEQIEAAQALSTASKQEEGKP